jgi:hypothetical protein
VAQRSEEIGQSGALGGGERPASSVGEKADLNPEHQRVPGVRAGAGPIVIARVGSAVFEMCIGHWLTPEAGVCATINRQKKAVLEQTSFRFLDCQYRPTSRRSAASPSIRFPSGLMEVALTCSIRPDGAALGHHVSKTTSGLGRKS